MRRRMEVGGRNAEMGENGIWKAEMEKIGMRKLREVKIATDTHRRTRTFFYQTLICLCLSEWVCLPCGMRSLFLWGG